MAFANSGDASIPAKNEEFEEFPKGAYEMLGIEDFFPTDDQGFPHFKPTSSNDLKCHCHFSVEGGPEGRFPAWSGTARDYYNLAKAVGANVEGLTVESTTDFLLQIQNRINATPRYAGVYVNAKGWVNKVNAMLPPSGYYRIEFVRAFNLDGSDIISFQPKESTYNGNKQIRHLVKFQFRIVEDADGEKDYAGQSLVVDVSDPFDGILDDSPAWKRAKNGGMLIDQRRLGTFNGIFWPDAEQYKWERNPEVSQYGIDEAANPIHVIAQEAMKSKRLAMVAIETTQDGFIKMNLADLKPAKGSAVTGVQPTTTEAPPWKTDAPVLSAGHKELIGVINNEAYGVIGKNVFDPSADEPFKMSQEGAEWCKTKIAPIWDRLKLGEKRNFSILTEQQAKDFAKVIRAEFDTSTF